MNGWINGRGKYKWMDEWIGAWIGGRMGEWKDQQKYRLLSKENRKINRSMDGNMYDCMNR